ncbi:MAG: hypothetical protein QNJ46_11280 [Leptolyngbyaceae cyanobacterium MO_188.B28]|nr:hypothetical protein [Leptolyngbyaceae cyanobacterium MO_188.B28]
MRLNSTLQKLIGSTPEEIVETAMQALKKNQIEGEVSNSGGFYMLRSQTVGNRMKTRMSKRAHHSLTSGGGWPTNRGR